METSQQAPASRSRHRPRGRRLAPAQRREELLQALEAVVARHGYARATVPRVVARARVAQGSFYRYFADLDQAFAELTRRVLAPVAEAVSALERADLRSRASLERALLAYYQVLGRQIAAHPAVVREALLVAPSSRGSVGRQLAGFLRQVRAIVAAMIAEHAGRGPFRRADPEIAAAAIVGMVLGAAQAATEPGASVPAEQTEEWVERWAREMARLECGALLIPSVSGRSQ